MSDYVSERLVYVLLFLPAVVFAVFTVFTVRDIRSDPVVEVPLRCEPRGSGVYRCLDERYNTVCYLLHDDGISCLPESRP